MLKLASKMPENHTIAGLQPHPSNPRTITPEKAVALKRAMFEFGDLGGVIKNQRTGLLIGGTQRTEAFRQSDSAEVHVTLTYQNPTRTGTVAEGYVLMDGERFSYRVVDWDDSKARSAAIACNTAAGSWDMGGLTAWLNDLYADGLDMSLTMFSEEELAPYLPSAEEDAAQASTYVAGDSDDFDPETGEARDDTQSRTQQVQVHDTAAGQVKAVQLFYDAKMHARFIEITNALRDAYGKDNLSDTVMEAVERAGVSAAIA